MEARRFRASQAPGLRRATGAEPLLTSRSQGRSCTETRRHGGFKSSQAPGLRGQPGAESLLTSRSQLRSCTETRRHGGLMFLKSRPERATWCRAVAQIQIARPVVHGDTETRRFQSSQALNLRRATWCRAFAHIQVASPVLHGDTETRRFQFSQAPGLRGQPGAEPLLTSRSQGRSCTETPRHGGFELLKLPA
jgi:hypothetical protein